MINFINGATFRKMLLNAACILDKNKEEINNLNVFPVPDGDTGTNMSMTMKSVVTELNLCQTNNIKDLSNALSNGSQRGGRGNSGVILSQIFKGMSEVLSTVEKIDIKTMAKAIVKGAETAYSQVSKPQEGTILTVAKDLAVAATKLAAKKKIELDDFFRGILDAGIVSLKGTPELLPMLKQAGVVDSGGQGLLYVYQAFYNTILGRDEYTVDFKDSFTLDLDLNKMFHANFNSLASIEFAYCTEFHCINLLKKTTQTDITKFKEFLNGIGDCVLVVGDLSFVHVHVHTNDPGRALSNALLLGEVSGIKIENMLEQAREVSKSSVYKKESGVVAVSSGNGLNNIFKELLVDNVLEGGQTMNPSAEDIAAACDKVGAKNVFLLPNNKNIILAAQQSKHLAKNCEIHVLSTTSIPQGISAMLGYDKDVGVEENLKNMQEACCSIKTGAVTVAVRDNKIDNLAIKEGDFIGLNSNKISVKSDNLVDATIKLVDDMVDENASNITLYFGSQINLEQAEQLTKQISEVHKDCDVDCQAGGQDLYPIYVAIE